MADTFRRFIETQIAKTGTAGHIASAIGMSLSAFSRGVRLEGSLGVDKLLRLAKWAGEDPSVVLRLGKKGDVASLIEELYGDARQPLSAPERELTALWRELEPDAQKALSTLLRALAHATRLQHQKDRKHA